MRTEDFTSDRAVVLRRQPMNFWAAIPTDLPPHIEPSWDLFERLSEADRALSELGGIARTLPNPHLLIQPFIRREAVLSSKIEGTQASLSDLFFFEASNETEERTGDVREVSNYVRALEYGLQRLKDFPMSLRLFKEIHEILIQDPTKTPGQFRDSQNWIGPAGCSLNQASYVPPPPHEMMQCLASLENFLHARGSLPPLIRYALVHYQFEAIHPFLDGNGRLGRLLMTMLLCADPLQEVPLLPQPLLYLSAFFERQREEYYSKLLAVSQAGAWEEWIRFFLKGVVEQSRDAQIRSDKLLELMHQYRQRLHNARASALANQIMEALFTRPVVSVGEIARRFDRTYAGVKTAIHKLMQLEILVEGTGRSRNRLYGSWDIIGILE